MQLEHEVSSPDIVESIKVITAEKSLRTCEYAFGYAFENGRKKVSAIHKANIQKLGDGMFLSQFRKVAAKWRDRGIVAEEVIVDNACMQMVSNPAQFDVIVTPNLYGKLVVCVCVCVYEGRSPAPEGGRKREPAPMGSEGCSPHHHRPSLLLSFILSDTRTNTPTGNLLANIVAGITGGVGVVPGVNVGVHCAVFEQGARHVAADIAGKGLANPTAGLFATVMLLRHLNLPAFSDRLEAAVLGALADAPLSAKTPDLGGTGTTASFMKAVKERL
jgi:isocitrate/isopropylmalate dehydrogenase